MLLYTIHILASIVSISLSISISFTFQQIPNNIILSKYILLRLLQKEMSVLYLGFFSGKKKKTYLTVICCILSASIEVVAFSRKKEHPFGFFLVTFLSSLMKLRTTTNKSKGFLFC